jgi:hypothetical protein
VALRIAIPDSVISRRVSRARKTGLAKEEVTRMNLNRALLATSVLALTCSMTEGLALAQSNTGEVAHQRPQPQPTDGAVDNGARPIDGVAVPRAPVAKLSNDRLVIPEGASGRLIVKFRDELKVRVDAAGRLSATEVGRMAGAQNILDGFGLHIESAFSRSLESLRELEERALAYSGFEQPDLGGMMYVSGPSATDIETAAVALNALAEVEVVSFEPAWGFAGSDPVGACCLPDSNGGTICINNLTQTDCVEESGGRYQGDGSLCSGVTCPTLGACCVNQECQVSEETECDAIGGLYLGDGVNCLNPDTTCEDPECGVDGTGDCFVSNGSPFCEHEDCCNLVCEIDPFCCDPNIFDTARGRGIGNWDSTCVFLANQLRAACGDDPNFNVCESPISQPCIEAAGTPGCNDTGCCLTVCMLNPACCTSTWDISCVDAALQNCATIPAGGATPSFTDGQGYLKPDGYAPAPAWLSDSLPQTIDALGDPTGTILVGYGGEGMNLQGLEDFGQALHDDFGVGDANQTFGAGINVGVVEFSAHPDHQELQDVLTVEPGQTVIYNQPQLLRGDHGTAVLGIIGAEDNGTPGPGPDERGVVGISPQANLWFFPTVSVEQPGGRTLDALASAGAYFAPGDVVSCSFTTGVNATGNCGSNLTTDPAVWIMLRLLSDLGITSCISAGNSACNLDDSPQAGSEERPDCDAVLVGACTPGAPYCREGFSSHCVACPAISAVHVSGWGSHVVTTGYGDLFNNGNNHKRNYTRSFGGTSAAAPMVAAVVARLQSFAKQFHGLPLTPAQIRGTLTSGNQCQAGAEDGRQGFGDYILTAPTNDIGGFISPLNSALQIVTNDYFDASGLLETVLIVRGNRIFGSENSVRATDSNYLAVDSVYTERRRGQPNNTGGFPPASAVSYFIAGQIVDVIAIGRSNSSSPTTITLRTAVRPPEEPTGAQGAAVYMIVEMWNYRVGRWDFVGLETLPLGGGPNAVGFEYTIGGAMRYMDPTRKMLARLYTVSPGGPPGPGTHGSITTYTLLIDEITFEVDEGFAVPIPIGGNGGGGGGSLGP